MPSVAKAESITGYTVRRVHDDTYEFCFEAIDQDGEVIANEGANTEKDALGILIATVYKIHSEWVRRMQGYLCSRCGQPRQLSIHHKIFRSHGRDDRISNLEGVCTYCHIAIHKKGVKEHGNDTARRVGHLQ